jgi:hypothetical protein
VGLVSFTSTSRTNSEYRCRSVKVKKEQEDPVKEGFITEQ